MLLMIYIRNQMWQISEILVHLYRIILTSTIALIEWVTYISRQHTTFSAVKMQLSSHWDEGEMPAKASHFDERETPATRETMQTTVIYVGIFACFRTKTAFGINSSTVQVFLTISFRLDSKTDENISRSKRPEQNKCSHCGVADFSALPKQ